MKKTPKRFGRKKLSTAAPSPAQQRSEALARASSRRAAIKRAFNRIPQYDFKMAWYKSRWLVAIFLALFVMNSIVVADQAPVANLFNLCVINLVQTPRGTLDNAFLFITSLGNAATMLAICVDVVIVLAILRHWRGVYFFLVNVVLSTALVHGLKLIFLIPRPTFDLLIALPSDYSYPSAHSFTSLMVLGLIGLYIYRALKRKGKPTKVALIPAAILTLIALTIGISRIYVGVHWPTDVIGGWMLAGAWLSFASALYLYEPTPAPQISLASAPEDTEV